VARKDRKARHVQIRGDEEVPHRERNIQELMIKYMERLITKLTFQLEIIIMQRKVKELSYRLAKIKKKEYRRIMRRVIMNP
jgi:hypothetical protein